MWKCCAYLVLCILLVSGCTVPKKEYTRQLAPGEMALRKITDPLQIPDFSMGFSHRQELMASIQNSLVYLAKPSSKEHYPYLDISHDRVVRSLKRFQGLMQSATSAVAFHNTIVQEFDVYESVGWNDKGDVLFTGYCEPLYKGSFERTGPYQYPVYTLPSDLVKKDDGTPLGRRVDEQTIVPYYTRQEIEDQQILQGQELVYLTDPFEVYIVHVQGSARIELPSGKEVRIGYAGKTDRSYSSVGHAMIAEGVIRKEDLSLTTLKEYFRLHPDKVKLYTHKNESYVFFTKTEGGPYGSLNVPVLPLSSIATDKTVFPRAALSYVMTNLPQLREGTQRIDQRAFSGFLLDQDTGGAIRSAGRADIYIGSGPDAERLAGYTMSEGRLYYLFLKQ